MAVLPGNLPGRAAKLDFGCSRRHRSQPESSQKPFGLSFTQHMKQKSFEVVAISPEPGAITPLRCERKMFPSNNFRKPIRRSLYIDC